MGYDEQYRKLPHYFGEDPEPLLDGFVGRIAPKGQVLDIGVGQGRNVLALARDGYRVTGIDPSSASIEVCSARARRENLTLDLWQGGFENYAPEDGVSFDAILVFGLLQCLPPEQSATLFTLLRSWIAPHGLVFLTAWHVGDPRFAELERTAERIAPRSFRLPNGDVRSYLLPSEILEHFSGWEIIHHAEGVGPEHQHGDGPLERHGTVDIVAKERGAGV